MIAEYKVSTSNRDVADPTEKVILTIPHPTNTNHNGGMLAFGPDGFLYIGVGDGGSANDPPNNAQNVECPARKDPADRHQPAARIRSPIRFAFHESVFRDDPGSR